MPKRRCTRPDCNGILWWRGDEYDSLANGGSYEIYECNTCQQLYYFPLPD